MSCEECKKDQEEFDALHPWPDHYLSEEERKTVNKYKRIKQLLEDCLENGRGLDYQWLYDNGKFCPNDWELLGLKFPKYDLDELIGKSKEK